MFAELEKETPESSLLLVGSGSEKGKLRAKAQKLGIADKVIFYGMTDHVERLLWAMDVFAFPSLFEGLGIAAVEAQAAGLPVVCSENVPKETRMTDQVQVVPTSKGASTWTKALVASMQRFLDSVNAVRKAGFNLADRAKQLHSYLKSVH